MYIYTYIYEVVYVCIYIHILFLGVHTRAPLHRLYMRARLRHRCRSRALPLKARTTCGQCIYIYTYIHIATDKDTDGCRCRYGDRQIQSRTQARSPDPGAAGADGGHALPARLDLWPGDNHMGVEFNSGPEIPHKHKYPHNSYSWVHMYICMIVWSAIVRYMTMWYSIV